MYLCNNSISICVFGKDINVKYVNVKKELEQVENTCKKSGIPFFQNSLPAINYIFSLKHIENKDT